MGKIFNIAQGPLHRAILGDTVMNKLDPIGATLQDKKKEQAVKMAAVGPSIDEINKTVGVQQTFGG